MNSKYKRCVKCNQNLPISDFYNQNTISGRAKRSYCKKCSNRDNQCRYAKRKALKYIPITEIEGEYWKDVVGWERFYKVSCYSRVKRCERYVFNKRTNKMIFYRERIMCQVDNGEGYLTVRFSVKGRKYTTAKVHKLMGLLFIENPQNKPVINHKNGIKNDNRIENLEWVTIQENVDHKYEVLWYVHPIGEAHPLSKEIIMISKDGKEEKIKGISEAARRINGDFRNISAVLRGKVGSHKGYKFKYA